MADAPEKKPATPGGGQFVPRGTKGLERFGGRIADEWLRRLEGRRGQHVFREMADNDDTVGAVMFAIEMLLRNVEWRVTPYSEDAAHVEQAEFVESLMDDMDSTWEDTICEILSMLTFGYCPLEILYKRRVGPLEASKENRSKHSDNRIGWRDLAIRSQLTVDRWEFDPDGDPIGLYQLPVEWDANARVRTEVFIPIEKLLIFRTTSRRGNPEGRSILRNAFVSWFYKKRIQESEAIGVERDLAGMPIFWLPPEFFDPDADAQTKLQLQTYRNAVENIKRDEQSGLLLPSMYDESGNKLVDFELAGTGARRLFDTDAIVRRYNRAIAQTVLADFILLGQDATGSYALSSDKTALFASAIGAILKSIAAVLNRQGVARLYELNGWNPAEMAEFVAGDIEKEDITTFATAIVSLTGAGWLSPGSLEDENHLREMLDMPELPEGPNGEDPRMALPGAPLPGSGMQAPPGQQQPGQQKPGQQQQPGGKKPANDEALEDDDEDEEQEGKQRRR